jgi:hypothetical protein
MNSLEMNREVQKILEDLNVDRIRAIQAEEMLIAKKLIPPTKYSGMTIRSYISRKKIAGVKKIDGEFWIFKTPFDYYSVQEIAVELDLTEYKVRKTIEKLDIPVLKTGANIWVNGKHIKTIKEFNHPNPEYDLLAAVSEAPLGSQSKEK